jgi:hypothetical protein
MRPQLVDTANEHFSTIVRRPDVPGLGDRQRQRRTTWIRRPSQTCSRWVRRLQLLESVSGPLDERYSAWFNPLSVLRDFDLTLVSTAGVAQIQQVPHLCRHHDSYQVI